MELALYCPDCGYYEAERDTLGRRGDFFTSASVGSLFGEMLAFEFSNWLEALRCGRGPLRIVEGGAHRGALARDILAWLKERRPDLFEGIQYVIVEPSVRRRQWQQSTLSPFDDAVRWVASQEALADTGVRGVIFCNELLDAMPVHRFGWGRKAGQWFEWGVALRDGKFVWSRMDQPESKAGARSVLATVSESKDPRPPPQEVPFAPSGLMPEVPGDLRDALPDGFIAEICPGAARWWSEAALALHHGKLMTLDYGLVAEEILSPERQGGTLRGYAGHRLSQDVLADPGQQDLTAHVNFGLIQSAGEAVGLATEQFTTQEQFLMRIAERFCEQSMPAWTPARFRQLQTLTHPEHLGRRFRVLVQSRA